MTYDEYWHKDPWLAKDYREAWKLKQEVTNHDAWLSGLYIYQALSTALYNAFREKGAKIEKYLERPLGQEEPKKTAKEIQDEVYDQLKRFEERWKNARNK